VCILPGTWRNPRSLVEKVVESLGNAMGKFANRHPNPSRFLCVFRWITPLIGLILVTTGEPKTCEHVVSLFNKHSVYMFLLQTRSSKWMFFHFLDMVQECCTLSWQIKYTHTQLPYLTHFYYWPTKTALAHIWLRGLYRTNAFSFLMGEIRVSKNLVKPLFLERTCVFTLSFLSWK